MVQYSKQIKPKLSPWLVYDIITIVSVETLKHTQKKKILSDVMKCAKMCIKPQDLMSQ